MTPVLLKAIRSKLQVWRQEEPLGDPKLDVISELLAEIISVPSTAVCHGAFEKWLTEHWPLWNDPNNIGGTRYYDLRAAFEAGWKQRKNYVR